jgi:hypothetical protein
MVVFFKETIVLRKIYFFEGVRRHMRFTEEIITYICDFQWVKSHIYVNCSVDIHVQVYKSVQGNFFSNKLFPGQFIMS